MGNEILNIFLSNKFFEESNIFRENEKKIFGGNVHFLIDGFILRQK